MDYSNEIDFHEMFTLKANHHSLYISGHKEQVLFFVHKNKLPQVFLDEGELNKEKGLIKLVVQLR